MGAHGDDRSGRQLTTMMTMIPTTLGLFAIWILLTGEATFSRLGLGLVVSFAVAWLNSNERPSVLQNLSWWRLLLYLPWLFLRIFQSGFHLAAVVLHPALPIAPRLIHYRTTLRDEAAIVLFANSITLTPGTITAEINADELVIHAIDDASADDGVLRSLEAGADRVFPRRGGTP